MQRVDTQAILDAVQGEQAGKSAGLRSPHGQRTIRPGKSQAYLDAFNAAFDAAQVRLVNEGPANPEPRVKIKAYYYIGVRCASSFVAGYAERFQMTDVVHFQNFLKEGTRLCVDKMSRSDQDFSAVYFRYGFEKAAHAIFETKMAEGLKRTAAQAELAENRVAKKPRLEAPVAPQIDWQFYPVEIAAPKQIEQQPIPAVASRLVAHGLFRSVTSCDLDEMDVEEVAHILADMSK